MNRIFSCLLIFITLISLLGCAPSSEVAQGALINGTRVPTLSARPIKDVPTVALVLKAITNPLFVEVEKGARRAEERYQIHLVVKTGAQETSIEQQIEIVEELIQAGVSAIIIDPADSARLIPVLKKARQNGITLINIDNRLNRELSEQLGLGMVPFIGPDNDKGAYLAAGELARRVSSPTHAAILEGIPEAINSQERKHGALRAFNESPYLQLTVLSSAHWKIDEAYQAAQEIFARDSRVGAIFCANDMMALGVLEYLRRSGREYVLVAGFDALDDARKAVQNGHLVATVDQQGERQGYLGVEYAVNAMRGSLVPSDTIVDVMIVSSPNQR